MLMSQRGLGAIFVQATSWENNGSDTIQTTSDGNPKAVSRI